MKGLLLISGGIDSPVAGYLMQRVGVEVVAVHYSSEPFSDSTPEKKSKKLAKLLGFKKIYIVNLSKAFEEIVKKCIHRFYFVLTKRLMFRIAERIAEKEECQFLITGENLGQVSSQTLQNLVVIDRVVKIPVFRPLLSYDKVEIINLAKNIRTYEISKGPEICDLLGPKHPATKAKEEVILEEEGRVDIGKLVEEAIKNVKVEKIK